MLIVFKAGFWARQVGHLAGQIGQVGQSRNRLMIVMVQYTRNMNIKFRSNNLELLLVSLL